MPTDPRPDDPGPRELNVPISPVEGASRGGRGRVAAAVVATGLVLTVVVGVLGQGTDPSVPVMPSRPAALATPSPEQPSRRTDPMPTIADRAEALPELASRRLTRAPIPVFHQRIGDDLVRLAWTPGQTGLVPIAPVPGAYAGIDEDSPAVVTAAPSGDLFAVRALASFGGAPADPVRLLTVSGRELWSRHDAIGFPVAPLWSRDGGRIVMPGPARTWRLLIVESGGAAVREVPVDATLDPDATPSPRPTGAASSTRLEPVGFSVDGRWLYAVTSRRDDPRRRPAARIAADDGRLEPVSAFPASGPEALDPRATNRYEVDPASGRHVTVAASSLTTGPTDVQVFEPNGRPAFVTAVDTILGIGWAGDGRLLVLEADRASEPRRLRLFPIGGDGAIGPPLLETGPLTRAALLGVRDGHALLVFATSGPAGKAMLAMVRLSDASWATHRIDLRTFESLDEGGWLS